MYILQMQVVKENRELADPNAIIANPKMHEWLPK